MIVTDGFVRMMHDADNMTPSGVVFGLCTGQMPTLESLRVTHSVVDKIYLNGPTEPTLKTIVPKQGGDILTKVYWATLQPIAGKGLLKLPLSAAPTQKGYIFKEAVPTWAFAIWNRAQSVNSIAIWNASATAAHGPCYSIALMSVGDENSSADIKIVGGKVFAGSVFQPADINISFAGPNVLS